MTTRADMRETAARVMFRQRYPASTPGDYDYSRDDYRNMATAVLDAVLPQITTVEQLRTLPARTWLLGAIDDTPQLLLRGSMDGKHLDRYLSVYGPLTVWQPQPEQETR